MVFNKGEFNTSVRRIVCLFSAIIISIIFCAQLSAHGTQVAYCVTTSGTIRVYIEHWHGNISPAATAGAFVNIRVTDTSTGANMTTMNVPNGVVWDTPVGSLPDCKGPLTVLSTCAGRANVYNDWAYWDFVPPACFINLQIEVLSVTGPDSWYYDEACGGLYPVSFVDSFIDCVAPNITCPATVDASVNTSTCESLIATGLEPSILFDDCTPLDELDIVYNITGALETSGTGYANGLTFPKGMSTIEYTVTDNTGKSSVCSFDVDVMDTMDPSIICPSDVTFECDEGAGTSITFWLSSVSASDNCGVDEITNDFVSVPNAKGITMVTFEASDICGNTATCQASFTIDDTVDPIINCPDDITLECGDPNNDAIITNWIETVTAVDDCNNNPTITDNYNGVFTGGCGATGSRTVTFTADDGCGNTEQCSGTITIVDSTPPEFLMKPQDVTVECVNSNGALGARNTWVASNGGAMASDDCDASLQWTRTAGPMIDLCGHTWSQEYTFTITDDCGNETTATATFTVEDTTPPNLNTPVDRNISCNQAANPTSLNIYLNSANANDPCSVNADITIEHELFSRVDGCGGTFTEVYLFTATDECGNSSTGFFNFSVFDTTIPVWDTPLSGHLTVECGDPQNPTIIQSWIETFSGTDLCDDDEDVVVSHNWNGQLLDPCNSNTPIQFSFTDGCGNVRTLNRFIYKRDRINPVFLNCPLDMTVNVDVDECGSNVVFPIPVAYDQCTQPLDVIQTLGPLPGTSFPVGTTTVRFDVRDECNRLGRCQFRITVVDTDTPSINCPSNVEACTDNNRCDWLSDDSVLPITMDNCTTRTPQVEITGATVLTRRNGTARNRRFNVGTSTVCYFVTDLAGNESSCCFDVIVTDCQDPVIICPREMTVECNGTGNADQLNAWLATIRATDNCTSVSTSNMLYNDISNCGNSVTWIYQFTATDTEGNSAICYSSFIIEDSTDPDITTLASDGSSNCDDADADLLNWLNTQGGAEAEDLCGQVTWSHEFVGGASTGCSGVPSLTVNFIATDECGNTAVTTADFNVEDNVVPEITCPANITLECGDSANSAIIDLWLLSSQTSDNCSAVTVSNDFSSAFTAACGSTGIYNVSFTAIDNCGNEKDCMASITILDTAPPVFESQVQDLLLECDGSGNTAAINVWLAANADGLASDICDDVTWTNAVESTDAECGATQIITYSFTVSDECGNENTSYADVVIEDTTNPILTIPADLLLECDGAGNEAAIDAWLELATATDACSGPAVINAVLFNAISGCGAAETKTYIFTATDACGNESTGLASAIINDEVDPTIVCPTDLMLECGTDANPGLIAAWLNSASSTDDCSGSIITNNYTGALPTNCGGTITVSFTATDDCGNTDVCMADIIMNDNTVPDFVNCPSDMTVNVDVDNCGSNPIFSTPIAVDNCDVTVVQSIGLASGSTFPVGSTLVEFTATDECGNTNTCQFNLTVVDSDVPTILCPSLTIDACTDEGDCIWTSVNIAPILGIENCPGYTISYEITGATPTTTGADDASGQIFELGLSTVCYEIEDPSGNVAECCFDVEVFDCEQPEINCPSDLIVECDGSGNASDIEDWIDTVIGTDNCDDVLTFSHEIVNTISTCGGGNTIVYKFTATDDHDNVISCLASFTIEDTTLPSIIIEAEDMVVDCDGSGNTDTFLGWLANNAGATASDLCSELLWSHDYNGAISDLCGATGTIDVIFTATDECGNSNTTDASFTITDTRVPNISCPSDLALECGDLANQAIINNWLLTVMATDDCSELIITNNYDDDFAPSCGATGIYTVTFTATDACGNFEQCTSNIIISDVSIPSFNILPQDLIVECDGEGNMTEINLWLSNDGNGVASDACDSDLAWSNTNEGEVVSCGTAKQIEYTFTIIDDCGNENTATAFVKILDSTGPIVVAPADMTVECDGSGNQDDIDDWIAEASSTDICSDPIIIASSLYNSISACGGGQVETYLFVATDDCGNETTALANFTIEDSTIPIITCPDNLELECGDFENSTLITVWLNSISGTDICSELSFSNNYSGTFPDNCGGSIPVVFTATDACGNTSSCTANIIMDDTTDPIFENCPNDITINVDVDLCNSNPIFSTPTAIDNCEVSVVQTDGPASGTSFPLGSTLVEFTATDDCDNQVICSFNIVVVDSDIPTILCPSNTITTCVDPGTCIWTSENLAPSHGAENCPGSTITYSVSGTTTATGNDDASGEIFEIGLSTICYTITDGSGNSSSCCFTVIVEDCEDPMIVCPMDLTIECDGMGNVDDIETWINTASSTDNCDILVDIFEREDNDISACGGGSTTVYEFTAIDEFGNTTLCYSSITIEDTTDPTIDLEAMDRIVECDGNGNSEQFLAWLNDNGMARASDLCSEMSWTNNYTGGFSFDCGSTATVETIFTASDACGNSIQSTASFTIEDTTMPTIACPADITLECGNVLNDAIISNWINTVEATDVCGSVAITNSYPDAFIADCGTTGTYTVTFTATDDCDNISTCTAEIIIEDNTNPAIVVAPTDMIVDCDDPMLEDLLETWLMDNGGAQADDECDMSPMWSNEALDVIESCGSTTSSPFIFIVTDACGNSSSDIASFITEDLTPPIISVPAQSIVECNGADNIAALNAWLASVTAEDNCSNPIILKNTLYNTISACGGGETKVYLFTATDDCGNSATGFSEFIIEDTSMPSIICPENLVLECGDIENDQKILQWLNAATATDICSDVQISSAYPGGLPSDCDGVLPVIFTATDACGNTNTCTAQILMDDTTDPVFLNCPPADLTINVDVDNCSSNPIFSTPIASDNCLYQVEQTEGPTSGSAFDVGSTAIEFTATDACGNTAVCQFNIIVVDSDQPTILCPSTTIVKCTDIDACVWTSDASVNPTANFENCEFDVTYNITGATTASGDDTAESEVFELGSSQVCYTITDENGNSSSCCFIVVIEDCQSPTIICPDDMIVECSMENEDQLTDWIASISATDNCAGVITYDHTIWNSISGCGNTSSETYLFSAEDLAGNRSTCLASFSIVDVTAPVITTDAENLTVECDGDGNIDQFISWVENNGSISNDDVLEFCNEYTWNNNLSDIEFTNIDPCDDDIGYYEVNFWVEDDCNNMSNVIALQFIIEDTNAPSLTVPSNIILECADPLNDAVIESWLNVAQSEDDCDQTIIVNNNYADIFADDCGLTGIYTVTFSAEDNCGNISSLDRTITLVDNTNPIITTLPEDLTLECADLLNDDMISVWEDSFGGAMAEDECSDEDLEWTIIDQTEMESCGNTSTTEYTFQVSDNCNNTAITKALVLIEDTTLPTLVVPMDQVEECNAIVISVDAWLNEATATDECGDVEIDAILWNTISGCGNTNIETYLFTATDECGNSSTGFAEYMLIDTTIPEISIEAQELEVECDGASNAAEILNWLNNNGYAEGNDTCGKITWSNNYGAIASDCGSSGEVIVTFTATDECGNSNTTQASFIINDTTAPTWEILPQDIEVECDGSDDPMGQLNAWLNTAGGADVEDDCSLIAFSNDYVAVDLDCQQQGGVLVTFTATDACGNATEATANIMITDDVPPEITSPAKDELVECDGEGNVDQLATWLNNNGGAIADDACSDNLEWDYLLMNELDLCGATGVFSYMFTATDACGNVSNASIADFIIEDTTSPTLTIAENTTVECDGLGNEDDFNAWLNSNGAATAEDVCSINLVWEYDLIFIEETCSITNQQTYRFTVIDDCGNSSSAEATFIIEDTTPPLISGGADMNMEECEPGVQNYPDFDFWLNNSAGATASDDCSDFIWTNDYDPDNWIVTCGNTRYVDVTWTATDDCDNSSEVTFRFGIGDMTPPEFTNCPPPIVVDAPDSWCTAYVNFSMPLATDNCSDDVMITQIDDTGLTTGDLFPVGLTILIFEAEDECGNTSQCEIKIIVNDFHTPPSISCPEDMTLNNDASMCGAIVDGISPVSFEDNCPENLSIIYEISDLSGNLISCGVEDASGQKFPEGTSNVSYTIFDQPILLITEIVQDGVITAVELTNFGPASFDVSCLNIVREGVSPESHNIPNGTVLSPGSVYVQMFTAVPSGSAAGYYIDIIGTIIDGVSMNGYVSSNYTFTNTIFGEDIYRNWICDHDSATDFVVADLCYLGSLGTLNPELVVFPDNGSTTSLQQSLPSVANCAFNITIEDIEAPYCVQYDTTRYELDMGVALLANSCASIPYAVPGGIAIADININNLVIEIADAGGIQANLTSPSGTTIDLFSNLCTGTSDVAINLDDSALNNLSTVSCGPLGQSDLYQPLGNFKDFYMESAVGDWILNISNNSDVDGMIISAVLEVLEEIPYGQASVELENDLGQCGALFSWNNPSFADNCCQGEISIRYETNDDIDVPAAGSVVQGGFMEEFFEVGTTTVIYTLVDQFGNNSTCSFDVTVRDTEYPEMPVLACQDLVVQMEAGQCGVDLLDVMTLPSVIDNCPGGVMKMDPPMSYVLEEGETIMTMSMCDVHGNSVACSFAVTVLGYEDPSGNEIACLSQVNMSLGSDCESFVTADMMLAGSAYGCIDDYCVTLTDEYGNLIGSSELGTNIVTEDHIGQNITVEICYNCDDSNCCWGNLLVENKLIPEVVCPADTTIACNHSFDPENTGLPEVTTCEQEIYFNYIDDFVSNGMCEDPAAMLVRTWFVTDESNNQIECEQIITIANFDMDDILYPADTILTNDVSCADVISNPELTHPDQTGYPTIGGIPVYETGDGLCGHFWNWDDQLLYNCEGSYEYLRKWIIRDMCAPIVPGVNPIEYFQSVKILDQLPPVFNVCPEDITVSNGSNSCFADVNLNDIIPEIIDSCGSVKDTFVTVSIGTVVHNQGEIVLTKLGYGDHLVRIRAKDQCSNYSTCEFNIHVKDEIDPVAICNEDLVVALSNGGYASLSAASFDRGSFDNCTDVGFEVARMTDNCGIDGNTEWGSDITLCCDDIGTPVMVQFRVWDDADYDGVFGSEGDHSNECWISVEVQNKILPDLYCPEFVLIECSDDLNDLSLTGQPSIGSICSGYEATYTDELDDFSDCGTGRVIRTWTINTPDGDISCTQDIRVEANDPFSFEDIVWQADWEGNCDEMIPENPPVAIEGTCDLVGVQLEADTFYFNNEACFKIVRNWKVIDWCQFNLNPGTGIWDSIQIIKVIDTEGPVITSFSTEAAGLFNANCTASNLNLLATAEDNSCGLSNLIRWEYDLDIDQDGVFEISGTAEGDTLNVDTPDIPNGMITVRITAKDGCNNLTTETNEFEVVDQKSPSAYCVNLSTAVMENGEVELWAKDFDAGSNDNCTDKEDLLFTFSNVIPPVRNDAFYQGQDWYDGSYWFYNVITGEYALDYGKDIDKWSPFEFTAGRQFTTEDIDASVNGTIDVPIFVWDEYNNVSSCIITLTLLDNNVITGNRADIRGNIKTEEGHNLMTAIVKLDAANPEYPRQNVSDQDGMYLFSQNPIGNDYEISCDKNDDYLNGVSTLDLVLIQKHVLGLDVLNSPYKHIAADINGDTKISSIDLIELRKLILGIYNEFPQNDSWRFVASAHAMNPLSPWPFAEFINIYDLEKDMMEENYVAVKIGDVNASAKANLHHNVIESRNKAAIKFNISDREVMPSEEFEIKFYAKDFDKIAGFQFTMDATALQLLDVISEELVMSKANFGIVDNKITCSWNINKLTSVKDGLVLFSLRLKAKKELLSVLKQIQFTDDYARAEIYVGNSLEIYDLIVSDIESNEFILMQNEPNPFDSETTIAFVIPNDDYVSLKIFNVDGKLINEINGEFSEGYNEIKLLKSDIGNTGLFYYQLETEAFMDTKKMIVIK